METLDCLTELGSVCRSAGALEEARETLTHAVTIRDLPAFLLVGAYCELGLAEQALGKLPEARAKLQTAVRILEKDPTLPRVDLPDLLRVIGEISRELGDFDEAVEAYRPAAAAYPPEDPLHWHCLQWLAHCQREAGALEPAIRTLEHIATSAGAPAEEREYARAALPSVRLAIADASYGSGALAGCLSECEALLPKLDRNGDLYPAALLLAGNSYVGLKKRVEARRAFEQVLASAGASAAQRTCAERGLALLSRR
jgi:tetratricopeptide (TPR) repeat protein